MDREELDRQLLKAATEGDTDKIWELIEQGADIDTRNKWGDTALMLAARKGHLTPELLEALVSRGADVNARDKDGMTALMFAAENGHLTPELKKTLSDPHKREEHPSGGLLILEAFVQHGADINMQTKYGWSALMMSAEKGYLTSELAHAYAEQFTRLGTPIEKINEQVDNDKSAVVLIAILLKKLETEPWLVVDFIKKHASRNGCFLSI